MFTKMYAKKEARQGNSRQQQPFVLSCLLFTSLRIFFVFNNNSSSSSLELGSLPACLMPTYIACAIKYSLKKAFWYIILSLIHTIVYPIYIHTYKSYLLVFSKNKAVCGLDCGLHGQCLDDACVCSPGWQGPRCNLKACSERCKGQCINGSCICHHGFNGQHCGIDACGPHCNSHGVCENLSEEDQRPQYE